MPHRIDWLLQLFQIWCKSAHGGTSGQMCEIWPIFNLYLFGGNSYTGQTQRLIFVFDDSNNVDSCKGVPLWGFIDIPPPFMGSNRPKFAFSALTLLDGWQEGHPACKNWVVGYRRGYLSGVRCRFTYGLADTTATQCLLLQKMQIGFGFTFLVPAHQGSPGQNPESRKMIVVAVVV